MNVVYVGGTGQQRAWFKDALAHMAFPWDSLVGLTLTVSWPAEPSAPGHKEYACTIETDAENFSIEIRDTLDHPDWISAHPPYDEEGYTHRVDPHTFYVECAAHELGHVLWFHFSSFMTTSELTEVCGYFEQRVNGVGPVQGTPADLHPAGVDWANLLQEGIAETLKDALVPDAMREFDNRTNWNLKDDEYDAFMGNFFGASGGGGTETVRAYWDGTAPAAGCIDPGQPGLTVVNDHLGHLVRSAGYPRFRYVGEDAMGVNSGVIDYPDFWTTDNPDMVDPAHEQDITQFGITDIDVGVPGFWGAYITDPDAPPVGGQPHVSLVMGLLLGSSTHGNWTGIFQISQFVPAPVAPASPYPPWPYGQEAVGAVNAKWGAVAPATR